MGERSLSRLVAPLLFGVVVFAATACVTAPAGGREPKVLLVFVDGLLPDAIERAEAPHLKRCLAEGAFSLKARAESTTISGSGWSSFLTGVHWDRHGVPDNAFAHPRYDTAPHLFRLVHQVRPELVCVSATTWRPIEELLVSRSGADLRIFHDYEETADDLFDERSADALIARELAHVLREREVDVAVAMFSDLDGIGHFEENAHYDAGDPLYLAGLAQVDRRIGTLLEAIDARPSRSGEDWLVIISTDHAGSRGLGHGRNIPEHRRIPLIVWGRAAAPGEILPAPATPDVVATALAHLGIEPREGWHLDGRPVGLAPVAQPVARFGQNLLANGGAEAERGFAGCADVPDAALSGWDDPGWMTAVCYGGAMGFPTPDDPGPPDRGESFFCGGRTEGTSIARQRIDLTPLAAELAGARYRLSGWLGGFASQEDSARVRLSFEDAAGRPLFEDGIGPVSAAERGGRTALALRRTEGEVPAGARSATVVLEASATEGFCDGYADELSLVLVRAGDAP